MDKTKIKHSKKRNTALLYEFFVRHISKCFIENKKDEAKKTLNIMKKYFHKGSALNEELQLFKHIIESQGKIESKDLIDKIISEVLSVSKSVNHKNLESIKSNLIKEINNTFNSDEFYSYRIPNYTVLASIQTLLNETRNKNKSISPTQKVVLQDSISTFLTENNKKESNFSDFNIEYGSVIYKVVLKKFNDKYKNVLTENQKKLLTKYAVYLSTNDKNCVKSFIDEQVSSIGKSLVEVKDKQLLQDKDLMNKLNECKKALNELKEQELTDKEVLQLLKYMELVEEIKN